VGSLWQDPIGALVEKELRALVRTPRFRVVFIMGFSFSLVILVPMLARHGTGPDYLLLLIFGYSMLLLGECCFWNVLGFDRGAAQLYFLVPRPFRQVLMAKNMVAALVVLAEFLCISTVALVFRLNFTGVQWLEAMAAGSVMALELVAAGNLASVHMPRAADPANVWRSGAAGRTQGLVTLMLPAVAAPIALAYLARYAFDTNLAFWGVLALVAALAGVFYWVSLDSAVKAAGRKKEDITAALSTGANPINS
jgi:ABC-2 type transport system permease protein